ncbi:MAG: serine/threonine-protein phosphatase [Clostridia bacterium]|nr:serine/threonine-protein phosphatase [Clostridia bacterium]
MKVSGATAAVYVNAAAISHMGCVRTNNEDNLFFNGDMMRMQEVNGGVRLSHHFRGKTHLFAVCDGMGGLNRGERASLIATRALRRLYKPLGNAHAEEMIREHCARVSEMIWKDTQKTGEGKKQGTTLALLMLDRDVVRVANVGDSRVYMVRMGKLVQISMDHTQVYTQMLRGEITREQARKHEMGNIINQYLGMARRNQPVNFVYARSFSLCNSDRFFICSDGASDLIPFEVLEEVLTGNASPEECCRIITEMALEAGGKDNITCIVGDISSASLPPQTEQDLKNLHVLMDKGGESETTQG